MCIRVIQSVRGAVGVIAVRDYCSVQGCGADSTPAIQTAVNPQIFMPDAEENQSLFQSFLGVLGREIEAFVAAATGAPEASRTSTVAAFKHSLIVFGRV